MSQQLPEWARRESAGQGPAGLHGKVRGGSFLSTAAKVVGWFIAALGVLTMVGAVVVAVSGLAASSGDENDLTGVASLAFAAPALAGGLVVTALGLALLMQANGYEDGVVYR